MHVPHSLGLPASRHAWLAVAATAALVAATLLDAGVAGAASPGGASRFHRAPQQKITGFTPAFEDKTKATFMLQLGANPVTVASANAGNKLSKAQKDAIKAQLKASQGPVIKAAKATGARVLGSYQVAYNGVKVLATNAQALKLAATPGVVAVHKMTPIAPDNVHGVPLIGAPQVWDGVAGLHGEGIKIGVIDTGIDYTHADFGGPGTTAAYQSALATDTAPANPAWFGPAAPKVKGGTDLVGDDYNADPSSADYQPVPHPDTNPLDCAGHGTHTSGTAAGFGVLSDGTTYTGTYDANTVSGHSWFVGPGVAPKADLYAIRVFGCAGSTDVVVDAIEWAVNNGMDVINMSLGAPFGSADDPDAVASDNAAAAGVIVVASAGNSGSNPYITGSPSTSTRAISVAASDPTQSFPAAHLAITSGPTIDAIDANGYSFADGTQWTIKVIYSSPGVISQGCSVAADGGANSLPPNTVIVVVRGTCARVAKAIFGQQAGAAAVIMVNTSGAYPPYEGPITSNPDDGVPYTVTIPFLGVPGSSTPSTSTNGTAFRNNDGGTITATNFTLSNPGYLGLASFTSGGPRVGDSWLKPDVTAPGVSIASAGMGTGYGPAILSGTSMAAPHTAGMAALVKQAHPTWNSVEAWKAAIVNTADPSLVASYSTRVAGAGFIQAPPAVATNVVATGDAGTSTLNYGFEESVSNYAMAKTVHLQNFGASAVTFGVSSTRNSGSPHSLAMGSNVTVPAHGSIDFNVTLKVPVATAGDHRGFHDVAGLIRFTPKAGGNSGVVLDVPYYLVPQANSKISINTASAKKAGSMTATIKNSGGAISGAADWYDWGISSPANAGGGSADVRAVGVQSFPASDASGGQVVFAINAWGSGSNAAMNEYDIYIDGDHDGNADYIVVGADLGRLTSGSSDGNYVSAVFNLHSGAAELAYFGIAPFNGRTVLLIADVAELCSGGGAPCLSAANPRISYFVAAYGRNGSFDVTADGNFNVYSSAVNQGMYDVVSPGGSATETLSVNATEQGAAPVLGWMAVSLDNQASSEVNLIPVP